MTTLATACPHTDRPMKARGLCKSCWSKEQRVNWVKGAAGAKGADTIVPKPKAAKGLGAAVQATANRQAAKQAKSVATLTAAAAAVAPAPPVIAVTAPDRIAVTVTTIGSTDAAAAAKKAARAAGYKVRTVAMISGGTPGAKVREEWVVDLSVRPGSTPAGDGAGPVPTPIEAKVPCGDCGELVSKSNVSRHNKRRHPAPATA